MKAYTKNHFKVFYRDMRIYYKTGYKSNATQLQKHAYENAIQNFHISYAKSWDYIIQAFNNRSKKDPLLNSDLSNKLFLHTIFKGL